MVTAKNGVKPSKLLTLRALLWPDVQFYPKQEEIIRSVEQNRETYVPAGNMLGKDYVAGFICIGCFIVNPVCRIVTTSVKDDHLRILWGEIGRFISTCKGDMSDSLTVNHREIRKRRNGQMCKISYLIGMVSERGEGMSGHHAPYTLFVADEASGLDDKVYDGEGTGATGWARRFLIFGNPNPCSNFFFRGVKGGDNKAPDGTYDRKVIRVRAEDSPNVQIGLQRVQQWGEKLTERVYKLQGEEPVIPGILTYTEYLYRRRNWSKMRQCIGLDGKFYLDSDSLLYPPDWLNLAEQRADEISHLDRTVKAIGIDPAEGGDSSVWSMVDEYGLIDQVSLKTPNTAVVADRTIGYIRLFGVDPENVVFDRGGGGKEHADVLRSQGYNVRTVGFGESVNNERFIRRVFSPDEKREEKETGYFLKNRRHQLWWEMRCMIDPNNHSREHVFALPAKYTKLREQMDPIPYRHDGEGRLWLPPKHKPHPKSTVETLNDIIGHSPDELDSLALAVFGLTHEPVKVYTGSLV